MQWHAVAAASKAPAPLATAPTVAAPKLANMKLLSYESSEARCGIMFKSWGRHRVLKCRRDAPTVVYLSADGAGGDSGYDHRSHDFI